MKKFVAHIETGEVEVIEANFVLDEAHGSYHIEKGDPALNGLSVFNIFGEVYNSRASSLEALYNSFTQRSQEVVDQLSKLEKMRHKIANAFMEEA